MKTRFILLFAMIASLLAACSAAPQMQASYDPSSLRFDGQRAYTLEEEFVTRFPYRSSGQVNNQLAAEWVGDRLSALGWSCTLDQWEEVNYSRPIVFNNTVCRLPGDSQREIVVSAHHDQAPTTVQGADNDGSGISILVHLAEVFAAEGPQPYTLVFLSSDAEEFGNLGARRFLKTHSNPDDIIAVITLDNLGKFFYNGMDMEVTGQFHKVGPLWLQLLAGEASRAAGDLWVPKVRAVMDQVTSQAVPINVMDQGPYINAGIPALGFAAAKPVDSLELHWQTYHSPEDLLEYQSADVLYQSGRNAEALVRQLLSMKDFPSESGPYLYLAGSNQVLRGPALWVPMIGFVALFFLGAYFSSGRRLKETLAGWKQVLPHYLGLWLPLAGSIMMLYLLVAVGLMDEYAVYPATTRAPEILNPRWPAVIIFLVSMAIFLFLGRWLVRLLAVYPPAPSRSSVKSFGLFMVGLMGVYILFRNPFSLLFCIPLLFWLLIGVRKGAGRILDIVFFLLGGLVVYFLFYYFGFVIQRTNFAVLWYILMMFSIKEITIRSAFGITALIAAGLVMIVNPPLQAKKKLAGAVPQPAST